MSLYQLTVKQALSLLQQKKVSSYELTKSVLDRIDKIDDKIKAYLTVEAEKSLRWASKADDILARENKLPSLLGIPISLKDNICVKGMRTTAASKVLDDYIAHYDATIVEKLKKSGAVIIGKTNMDAWAHGSSTEASDYFTTRNPWDLSKLPGGSSGGSAASVISDMTIGSIGTETAGSIRQPAAWCGVVGLKPTYGRVSRYGIISMGSSFDCPGPITKTVEDAAIMLEVVCGFDPKDATSSPRPKDKYVKSLKRKIKGLRIGVVTEYIELSQKKVQKSVMEAVKLFEKLGAKIKNISLVDPKYSICVYTILQRSEVSANLARYDGIRYGYGRDKFGREAKRRIMLGAYALSVGYYDELYAKAQRIRTMIISDFERIFKEVDVIIGPTSPSVALPLGSSNSSPMFGEVQDVLVEPSTIAGLPGINLVCGFQEGLPVGLQIIGPQFSEELILKTAFIYERETQWHKHKPLLRVEKKK